MTARCGSDDREHRTGKCRACKAIYNRRYKKGATPRPTPVCVLCGLAAGNSMGIHVRQYALIRSANFAGRKTSICIGSIGFCNRCVADHAQLNGKVRLTPKARMIYDGLRANDSMPTSLGT